jgi:transcriptional regulator GlxA family with amidase domain
MDSRVAQLLKIVERKSSLRLTELAAEVNLSHSRLEHIFKREIGVSLRTYLAEIRIQMAADLLRNTQLPVKNISYRVGYRHVPSFIRAFRRKFKRSPQNYRVKQHNSRIYSEIC